MTEKEIEIDGKKIPYTAIGCDEIEKEAKPRIAELFKTCEDSKEDGIKLLSLLISRGKTEKGKTITCECGKMYLVFPYEENKECECGRQLRYKEES